MSAIISSAYRVSNGQTSPLIKHLIGPSELERKDDYEPSTSVPEHFASCNRLEDFFNRTSDINPERICAIEEGITYSYRDIDVRSNRLANYLIANGIVAGMRIGLIFEPSIDLYVCLVGTLKAGGVYVPMDPSFPIDRLAYIVNDSKIETIITVSSILQDIGDMPCNIIYHDRLKYILDSLPNSRPKPVASSDSECYICYTSGSTGVPKGTIVTHYNICNFIRAATPIYGFRPSDLVYQGMSAAFDFSIEEIWTSFAVGATLVPRPAGMERFGERLCDFLDHQRINILCCVPTLLATLNRDIPSLRLLMVGGEACSRALVQRWSKPWRRILNTYGPTETTVTATWTELLPDRPVTIGKALPTYSVYLLDDRLMPVHGSETGEICIGGPGVAKGYVNRPDLTAERFLPDPFSPAHENGRLYRTGDLGRYTENGEIEFLGRCDTQVKIRGYRIELSEIEEVIRGEVDVRDVVVSVVCGNTGTPDLVAYVVLAGSASPAKADAERLHRICRDKLPSYMVPAWIEFLSNFPVLTSGKVDRNSLPPPKSSRIGRGGNIIPPATSKEARLVELWKSVLGIDEVSVEADFFTDLGGHSLLAAYAIAELRRDPDYQTLSMGDIYNFPTIRSLARHCETLQQETCKGSPPDTTDQYRKASSFQVYICGLFQGTFIAIYLSLFLAPAAFLLYAIDWGCMPDWTSPALWSDVFDTISNFRIRPLNIYSTLVNLTRLDLIRNISRSLSQIATWPTSWKADGGLPPAFILLLPSLMLVNSLLLPILVKKLIVGKLAPGRYPLWGATFLRWWIERKTTLIAPTYLLAGTPFLNTFMRALGATIGKNAHLISGNLNNPSLVVIGDGATIGYDTELEPFRIADGWLHLGAITIGRNVGIGPRCLLMADCVLEDDSRIGALTLVSAAQRIEAGQYWQGSPAHQVPNPPLSDIKLREMRNAPGKWTKGQLCGFLAGILVVYHAPFHAALAGMLLSSAALSHWGFIGGLAAAVPAGLTFVLMLCGFVAFIKRLCLPHLEPGIYPLRSIHGVYNWLSDKLMETSLFYTNSLYSTLYTAPWLRLLGAKVGARAEISTVSDIDPDLLTLGDECFVADMASVGPTTHLRGWFEIGPTTIGKRSFVGNAALVPANSRMEDNSLLGVQSTTAGGEIPQNTSWLGSPALYLPNREVVKAGEAQTYRPPLLAYVVRLVIEFFRVTLPEGLSLFGASLVFWFIKQIPDSVPLWQKLMVYPMAIFGTGIGLVVFVAIIKWALVGSYRPRKEPNWAFFVRRTELVTALYENVSVSLVLVWLTGTPWLAPFLRIYGVKIGQRVYCDSTFITEFDLVEIGDDCTIGKDTSLQTHLFEDRVMKMSKVKIENLSYIGSRCVVLYDAVVSSGSYIENLSLVMKAEFIPARSRWIGIPAYPYRS
ncbi:MULTISPECIES: Pls/PosA family non-ribosomal peptide synthetase [Methylococcus]|uniref:Amino acid adenylation domain-containing protein n=1 Tax=Methylococcus capsulatus TaxID=414 RepID=A0ABZ2F691_METCP|nr:MULTISPECIES: Pls/PosA family non-ribosomal peptide synthetase [Methylococcus]